MRCFHVVGVAEAVSAVVLRIVNRAIQDRNAESRAHVNTEPRNVANHHIVNPPVPHAFEVNARPGRTRRTVRSIREVIREDDGETGDADVSLGHDPRR